MLVYPFLSIVSSILSGKEARSMVHRQAFRVCIHQRQPLVLSESLETSTIIATTAVPRKALCAMNRDDSLQPSVFEPAPPIIVA